MLSRLHCLWTGNTPSRPASRARPAHPRRPRLEALEDRQLLSVFPGEIHVNTTIVGNQIDSDNATNTSGHSVVVWTSVDGANNNIRAQRYDAAGIKQGPEILVAGGAASDTEPAVSMDNAGNFVVVWTQGAGAAQNIVGQRFNAGGGLVGGLMNVAGTGLPEFDPDVAVATAAVAGQGTGAFVVTYTRTDAGGNENVFAHMRRSDGTVFNNLIPVATNAADDHDASVARAPGGAFAIAFQTDAGANSNIFLQRRNAAGGLINNLTVANTVNDEDHPDVDLDTSGNAATPGNAVVVWEERLGAAQRIIRGRKVNGAGVLGAAFVVDNLGANINLTNPVVALRGNGNFVVAYERSGSSTRVREMSAAAVPVILATNDLGFATRIRPAISIVDAAAGPANYLVTFTKSGAFDDPGSGIFGRYGNLA